MLNLRNVGRVVQGLAVLWVAEVVCTGTGVAQIVPDGTLPVNSSVSGCPICTIDGGTVRGTNLFHSFSQFSVPMDGEAFFNNAAGIQNILTRVTGGTPSTIDGLIRTNGTANLFLLNPNGIIFGASASLNIQGSFFATTANSFVFPDGSTFSAVNPQAPPLLTVTVPIGLQYGATPGVIQTLGDSTNSLEGLKAGRDLTLAGGNLDLQGPVSAGGTLSLQAQDSVTIQDSGSLKAGRDLTLAANNLDLRGQLSAGRVLSLQAQNSVTILNLVQVEPGGKIEVSAGGDVSLQGGAALLNADTAIDRKAGDIAVTARSLSLSNGARINSDSTDNATGNAGDVTLNIREALNLEGNNTGADINTAITSNTSTSGKAGNITIAARSFSLSNGAQISSQSLGRASGNAGNVTLNVQDTVSLDTSGSTPSAIFSIANFDFSGNDPRRNSTGNGGDISITTGNLLVKNGSEILANNFGDGPGSRAGNIIIQATGRVVVDGYRQDTSSGNPRESSSTIASNIQSSPGSPGIDKRGGLIDINAASLEVLNGGSISTNLEKDARGNAGFIQVNASQPGVPGNVLVQGQSRQGTPSRISTSTQAGSIGSGGTIEINASNVELSDFGQINAETRGQGDPNFASLISLTASNLLIRNSGAIVSDLFGTGKAGAIGVTVSDRIALQTNGRITSVIRPGAQGEGGFITLDTGTLSVADGAAISASTQGKGVAGDVYITAQGQISLERSGRISSAVRAGGVGKAGGVTIGAASLRLDTSGLIETSTAGIGDAGNIFVTAIDSISLQQGAQILNTVEATGNGVGGNIDLRAPQILLNRDAAIKVDSKATNNAGAAGTIEIQADRLTLDNNSAISAETLSGQGGNITLTVSNLLLLRRGSVISTSAGNLTNPGSGGKLTIEAKNGFIVGALAENSDIIANAFGGAGGTITLKANQVYGFKRSDRLSSAEIDRIRINRISDISASSDIGDNGIINVQTLNIDPANGLIELPVDLVDPSKLIAQGCGVTGPNKQSAFVVTGRGGVPGNATESQGGGALPIPWVSRSGATAADRSASAPPSPARDAIVEAQGIEVTPNGEIRLITTANTPPHGSRSPFVACPQARN